MNKYLLWFAASFAAVSVSLISSSKETKAAPPANFQSSLIVGTGLNGPSGFGIAPDGRIFILERTGAIKIYKNGNLLPTEFANLPSAATGDRGLIGVVFDPDFSQNNFVYFYYTGTDLHNRLVRFDASGDTAIAPFVTLYQTNFLSQELHVGGTAAFGLDGKIYLAVGDNGYPPNGQDLTNPHGKILRLNKDGSVPTDNPFYGQNGKLPEIWAYGFRNPWRFTFDSANGKMYAGDVGEGSFEEINQVVRGGNYGWPICEGYCSQFTQPLYAYGHSGPSSAITAGPVYRGSMFPAEYQGSFFFGDYGQGFIRRAVFDGSGNISSIQSFDDSAGSVVDLHVAPDGSLYYLTYYPGRLYRINYSTGNHIPVANSSSDVSKGLSPLAVQFSSQGSFDPDGASLSYLWDFGEGSKSTEANPQKTFSQNGTYIVSLTVSDGANSATAVPLVIQVGLPPSVTLAAPLGGSNYKAGDTIFYSGHGVDGAGFDLPDKNFTTEVVFHHHDHIHPFLGPIVSKNGSFTIPDTGEPDPDTWYEVKLTGKDSNGLLATAAANIYPLKSTVTFQSSPAGLDILLDGTPTRTPAVVEGVVGFKRWVDVSSQGQNGNFYEFNSWSDGGNKNHQIEFPEKPITLTANFSASQNSCGSVGSENFTGCYYGDKNFNDLKLVRTDNDINFSWGLGSPGLGVSQDNFSARWSGDFNLVAGAYTFTSTTDDGVRVYVDGQKIIDFWQDQSAAIHAGTINLSAGVHRIVMEYYENGGEAVAKLSWQKTGDYIPPVIVSCDSPANNAFNACFYDQMDLSDYRLSRTDSQINFDWGLGSPDSVISPDTFSASWTGNFNFDVGTYDFSVTADDGVRLYIDGQILIDQWKDQGPTAYAASKTLVAGFHVVRMEYYENGGEAVAKLSWQKTSETPPIAVSCQNPGQENFTGCYYNDKNFASLALIRTDAYPLNFSWGLGSPDPKVNKDNFSAVWQGNFNFDAAAYTFKVTSDDGVKVYIDNELILDKFFDQGPTNYSVDRNIAAGMHLIKIQYYENGGEAVAQLSWLKIANTPPVTSGCETPAVNSFTGCYYSNMNFSGAPLIRTDTAINFSWGLGSPNPQISADKFSAKWLGQYNFAQGAYNFTVTADDGVRLYIDDALVLDKFIDQSPTTYIVNKILAAGLHVIRMEYYENGGEAVARLSW